MSGAEIATLSTHDEDFYSISLDHLFANNVICTEVRDPGAPALKQIPKYQLHAHVWLSQVDKLSRPAFHFCPKPTIISVCHIEKKSRNFVLSFG